MNFAEKNPKRWEANNLHSKLHKSKVFFNTQIELCIHHPQTVRNIIKETCSFSSRSVIISIHLRGRKKRRRSKITLLNMFISFFQIISSLKWKRSTFGKSFFSLPKLKKMDLQLQFFANYAERWNFTQSLIQFTVLAVVWHWMSDEIVKQKLFNNALAHIESNIFWKIELNKSRIRWITWNCLTS